MRRMRLCRALALVIWLPVATTGPALNRQLLSGARRGARAGGRPPRGRALAPVRLSTMRSRVDRSGCSVMMVPQVARIAFLFNMSNPVLQAQWKEAEPADLPVEQPTKFK